MKTLLPLLALLAGCGGCVSVPNLNSASSTVRLEMADGGICSGTAVGPYTVLTARHCLDADSGPIKVDDQQAGYAVVADDGEDHILVRVTVKQDHIARWGNTPKRGDEVWKQGNPLGLRKVLLVGRVAGWLDDGSMLIDITGYKGDSGAALFDDKGQIVGVISAFGGTDAFYLMIAKPLKFTQKQLENAAV